jgi:hypothetical protein
LVLRLRGSKPAVMRSLAAAALALVVLAAAVQVGLAQPVPAPSPEPAPVAPAATPSPVPEPPTAAPLPTPSLSPSPSPSPSPTATASGSPYHYVVNPPAPAAGQPVILEIDMLDQVLHPGTAYSVRVHTSPDVTAINVTAMGQTYGMQAAGPGLFASDGQVPGFIPFFMLNRSYTITVTAMTADGKSTTFPLPLRLER